MEIANNLIWKGLSDFFLEDPILLAEEEREGRKGSSRESGEWNLADMWASNVLRAHESVSMIQCRVVLRGYGERRLEWPKLPERARPALEHIALVHTTVFLL